MNNEADPYRDDVFGGNDFYVVSHPSATRRVSLPTSALTGETIDHYTDLPRYESGDAPIDVTTLDFSQDVALHLGTDNLNITGIRSQAKVVVEGNLAKIGGGVASNGIVNFGDMPPIEPIVVNFSVMKEVEGQTLLADAFQFELKDNTGKVLQTQTNNAQGFVAFDSITYEEVGTYTYTVNEVIGEVAGMTYDQHILPITVEVSLVDRQLVAEIEYEASGTFINVYQDIVPSETETTETSLSERSESATTSSSVEAKKATTESNQTLPATGEQKGHWISLLGVIFLLFGYCEVNKRFLLKQQ